MNGKPVQCWFLTESEENAFCCFQSCGCYGNTQLHTSGWPTACSNQKTYRVDLRNKTITEHRFQFQHHYLRRQFNKHINCYNYPDPHYRRADMHLYLSRIDLKHKRSSVLSRDNETVTALLTVNMMLFPVVIKLCCVFVAWMLRSLRISGRIFGSFSYY